MAIAKFLQVSDIHNGPEMNSLESIVNLANSISDLDAVLVAGDIYNGYHHKSILEEGSEEITEEDQKYLRFISIYEMVQKHGLEKAKQANLVSQETQAPLSDEEKNKLFEDYENNLDEIEKLYQKMKINAEKEQENLGGVIEHIKKSDEVFGNAKMPVYAVRGNHDRSFATQMSNVEFLEETGVVDIKGVKIAGAPNVGQRDNFGYIDGQGEPELEDHFPAEKIAEFIREHGDKEDFRKLYESSPVYQRLKDQEFDVLLAHKGLNEFAGRWDTGLGLTKIVQEKKPAVICSGHLHGKGMRSDEFGYYGLRSTDKIAYVWEIDTNTKEIESVEIYEKIYRSAANPSMN